MRNETFEHRILNVDWSIGLFTAVTTIHRFSGRHAPSRRPTPAASLYDNSILWTLTTERDDHLSLVTLSRHVCGCGITGGLRLRTSSSWLALSSWQSRREYPWVCLCVSPRLCLSVVLCAFLLRDDPHTASVSGKSFVKCSTDLVDMTWPPMLVMLEWWEIDWLCLTALQHRVGHFVPGLGYHILII